MKWVKSDLWYINGISGKTPERCSDAFFPSSVLLLGTWAYWLDTHSHTGLWEWGHSLGMAKKLEGDWVSEDYSGILYKLGTVYSALLLCGRERTI